MRVATCLPSATEIVCAVGGRAALVAISHPCDWPGGPGGITALPRLTLARMCNEDAAVDRAVFAQTAPDLIVTDDQAALATALGPSLRDVTVLVLAARSLAAVFADLVRVGDALDLGLTARAVVTGLRARLQAVSDRAATLTERPRVHLAAASDATHPWLAELLAHAGGTLAASPDDADVVLTLGPEAASYATRAGPRLVDAVELLAASLHPAAFPELVRRHAGRGVAIVRRADPSAPGAASGTS